jgi:hypothetical protein
MKGTKKAIIYPLMALSLLATNLYVKCADQYGNIPAPDECSMVVRAAEDYSKQSVTSQ